VALLVQPGRQHQYVLSIVAVPPNKPGSLTTSPFPIAQRPTAAVASKWNISPLPVVLLYPRLARASSRNIPPLSTIFDNSLFHFSHASSAISPPELIIEYVSMSPRRVASCDPSVDKLASRPLPTRRCCATGRPCKAVPDLLQALNRSGFPF
jgi:hypothetical protein